MSFETAADFSIAFITASSEQQLQYLDELNDALRTTRRQVIRYQDTADSIDKSTRTFASGWQGDLQQDISGYTAHPDGSGLADNKGQTDTTVSKVEALFTAFQAVPGA